MFSGAASSVAAAAFRNGEKDRQHAPEVFSINHLDAPLPDVPAPRCEERGALDQLDGVRVCRPEVLQLNTKRVWHLLAASACKMEEVARHQSRLVRARGLYTEERRAGG